MDRLGPFVRRGAALLCLVLVGPRAATAYQQTDLAATWEFHSLASGPGAPWWERARATVAPSGFLTAFTTTSTGDADTIQATFALSAAGIVTLSGASNFHGALDFGTTVLAATDTWSSGGPGTTELKVGVKMVGGYALSDLTGDWELNTIVSGPGAPWWIRGRLAIAADGSFTGTLTDSDGQTDQTSGSFGISPDGIVSISVSSGLRGALDAGKSVMVMTNTWTGYMAGTTELGIAVKMAQAYSLADIAGTWELHSLATGPGAPWWSRGQLSIAPDGSYTGAMIASNGGSGPTSGSISISPNGVMTSAGASAARGVLDAGKSVMVWTDIWDAGSPGTTEILVLTRTSPGTVSVDAWAASGAALAPVYPNPTRGGAPEVRFRLPGNAPAQLELLDVSGRRLTGREVGALGAGGHALRLGEGGRLAPGLYFVRLRTAGADLRRKVVVTE